MTSTKNQASPLVNSHTKITLYHFTEWKKDYKKSSCLLTTVNNLKSLYEVLPYFLIKMLTNLISFNAIYKRCEEIFLIN